MKIYADGKNGKPEQQLQMTFDPVTGTWSARVPEKLYGKFYTFQIKNNGRWLEETPGVWAKAVGVNGKRAAIIDFSKTNPKGWDADKGPKVDNFTDVVLYEMHHRDMSMSPSSGIANKGKFLAMTENGTTNNFGEKTGIDHLKELGVTHVHILPSYDYNSVDEMNLQDNTYNWGYDPLNYNAPEGSYSTNPSASEARIREMKEMVKALHDAGIGVVMDVVYNHTAQNNDSNFSLTSPGYFYRHNPDGTYSDASGCGNETASDRRMMQDFIVNSVKYTIEKLGGTMPDAQTLLKFIGPPLQESFMEHCGYSREKAVEGVRVFREHYVPVGQYENEAAPGMRDVLERLKAKGYTLALASSKPEELCVSICRRFGFTPFLSAVTGSPAGADWEKADVIREAMRRLRLTDGDKPTVLMVGDRKYDVLGAQECGLACVGVEFFGYAAPGELAEAGAAAVVQTPEELEDYILNH